MVDTVTVRLASVGISVTLKDMERFPTVGYGVVTNRVVTIFALFQVYIIAHVPPGMFELGDSISWFYASFNKKYLDVMERYQDVIAIQLYGHEHTDSFRVQVDAEGRLFLAFSLIENHTSRPKAMCLRQTWAVAFSWVKI